MSPRKASPLEAELEEKFFEAVRSAGGRTFKMIPTVAGIPDRIAFFPGHRAYLVELKKDDGTVSPIQKVWHDRFATMGWHVHVLFGLSGVENFIRAVVTAMGPVAVERRTGNALDDIVG